MDSPGTIIAGRYELLELVAHGGMATVWRAALKGPAGFEIVVALKRMLPSLAEDPEFVTMFVEEAKIAALLSHPNVTRVHELGRDDEGFFLVMEWVEGIDLSRLVRSSIARGEYLPWWMPVHVAADALLGLESAHARCDARGYPAPVFHRDVDPQNVLVGSNGIAKLTDFGLAFAVDRVRLTQPGILKGKLSYVAPELLEGAEPSVLTDLYSMGVVLWEALTGETLFLGRSDIETLENVQRGEVPPLSRYRNDLPPSLEPLLLDVLSRDTRQRVRTAAELSELLADVIFGEGIRPSSVELGRAVRTSMAELAARDVGVDRAATAALLAGPARRARPSSPTPEIPLVRRKH